ncbi:MAG: hypothetical protein HS126_39600 [Anaerolineales bacterium]|nr:hypothetical protein [Anaerolineales bacterium]
MTKSAGFYDLRQAFGEPGCALCRLLAQTADSYIDSMLWELVNDPELRQELNQTRGYCREHAWLLVRHGASLGAAIMMKDIIDTLVRVASAGPFDVSSSFSFRQMWQSFNSSQPSAAAQLAADFAPQAPCPVCVKVQSSEGYYLAALRQHLTGLDSLAPAYQASAGLCLPHFRRVLAQTSDRETLTALVEAQKAVWQRLSTELSEFIRKKDHRFQHESYGSEGDSWLRAIEAVVGTPPKGKGG